MFQQYAYAGWPQGTLSRQVVPYGAIFLGSRIQYALYGAWKIRPDNSREAAQTLEEQGIVLRSREDALRALAELYCTHSPQQQMWTLAKRVPWELATTRDWNIDSVVFCLDRTCHGLTPALLECRAALQKAGIPSMVYEASAADPREFHREKVVDTLESFLEQMGLTKTA